MASFLYPLCRINVRSSRNLANLRGNKIKEEQYESAYLFKLILKCEKLSIKPNPSNYNLGNPAGLTNPEMVLFQCCKRNGS